MDVLCLPLPRLEDPPVGTGTRDREQGGSGAATVSVQIYGDPEEQDIRLEILAQGRPVPISLVSPTQSLQVTINNGGRGVGARPVMPTVRVGHSPCSTAGSIGGLNSPSVFTRHHYDLQLQQQQQRVEALGAPLTLTLDLSECRGPGQIRINLWSAGSGSNGPPRLLAYSKGLLLPARSRSAAREITRCERSQGVLLSAFFY